ncbi:MAG: hypothetical protein ACMG6E_08350, partial [Candidatus Roizmanbacteria bacterium]
MSLSKKSPTIEKAVMAVLDQTDTPQNPDARRKALHELIKDRSSHAQSITIFDRFLNDKYQDISGNDFIILVETLVIFDITLTQLLANQVVRELNVSTLVRLREIRGYITNWLSQQPPAPIPATKPKTKTATTASKAAPSGTTAATSKKFIVDLGKAKTSGNNTFTIMSQVFALTHSEFPTISTAYIPTDVVIEELLLGTLRLSLPDLLEFPKLKEMVRIYLVRSGKSLDGTVIQIGKDDDGDDAVSWGKGNTVKVVYMPSESIKIDGVTVYPLDGLYLPGTIGDELAAYAEARNTAKSKSRPSTKAPKTVAKLTNVEICQTIQSSLVELGIELAKTSELEEYVSNFKG